jgi:hypothetical protein
MTPRRNHHKQALPNRRFRRLLPAAVASAALVGASVAGPAAVRADVQRAAHAAPPAKVASLAAAKQAARDASGQPNSASV